ncbi:MAG: hypothetical protein CVU46_14875 [Chloroflexi bacterium HGW-Chloroflexi-8]|nr:MAG: hypothetical protein CVU46_14875 [Chloroflexi bacterium HGW-Chloroflexi-8]
MIIYSINNCTCKASVQPEERFKFGVEEVFFRRWIMDMFMKGVFNPILQVFISGVIFGLVHASWTLLSKHNFKATLPAILATSILGIFLAIIYLAGERNLGPCIFAHVLINIIIEPWLMLSSVSGKWRYDD